VEYIQDYIGSFVQQNEVTMTTWVQSGGGGGSMCSISLGQG
jgi:hypothetical protein